jgi:glycosyltransferase involved in cell wall biosynthesis
MVNSPGFVDHVQQRGALRVELVPNGVDSAMFREEQNTSAFRENHHLVGKFVVVYAGAHGMSNDLGVLLESARQLAQKGSPVRIILLGDGKEKPALQAQAAQLGLENILFLPPLPKAAMAEVLAGADACLAILKPLDEYKTTYPNKVFDYMAAGRPVVLAIDGVIREVVQAAGCGVFASPGDPAALTEAIETLAGDRDRCRRMGLAGRQYLVEHFDREKMAQTLLGLLNSLAGPSARAR